MKKSSLSRVARRGVRHPAAAARSALPRSAGRRACSAARSARPRRRPRARRAPGARASCRSGRRSAAAAPTPNCCSIACLSSYPWAGPFASRASSGNASRYSLYISSIYTSTAERKTCSEGLRTLQSGLGDADGSRGAGTRRPTTQPSIEARRREGGEEAAGGHRVAARGGAGGSGSRPQEVNLSASGRLRLEPPASARSSLSRSSTPSIAGTASASISAARPEADGQLVGVAEQAEAGHVGERVRARRARLRGGARRSASS